MKTNKEFLTEMGIKLIGNAHLDNVMLNEYFKTDSKKTIFTYYTNGQTKQKVILTPTSHDLAFADSVWQNLSLAERLRVLKWREEQYLKESDYSGAFPRFVFVSRDDLPRDVNYVAMARKDSIEFVLENLTKCSGYSALTTVIHECIHEIDYRRIFELLGKYTGTYLPRSVLVNYTMNLSHILELPLEGKILNLKTNSYDMVSEKMAEDFLLLKNLMVAINSKIGTSEKKKNVVTKLSFEKYMRRALYMLSPLEERAFEGSCEYANYIILNNKAKLPLALSDVRQFNHNKYTIQVIQGKKREIQKYYKLPYAKAVNMELIHEYNTTTFAEDKNLFILPELMEDRKNRLKYIYERYFEGHSIEEKNKGE